jgi:hypothetical protein
VNTRRLLAPLGRLSPGPRDLLWAVLVVSLACAWYRPHRSLPWHTGKPYDLAILGNGYFLVHHERNDTPGLVRHGRFTTDGRGVLYYGHPRDGWVLQPQIELAFDHQDVTVTHDGIVAYSQTGNPQPQQAGQLQLALVTSPQHLKELVPGVFQETLESGCLMISNPGTNGVGLLQQGWLEPATDGDFDFGPGWDATTWCLALLTCGLLAMFLELRRLRQALATMTPQTIVSASFVASSPSATLAPLERGTLSLQPHVGDGHLF